MIGRMVASMVEKNYDNMLVCFHLIPERHGRTDGRTDRFAIRWRATKTKQRSRWTVN